MARGLRAIGAFMGGLVLVFVLVLAGTSIVLGGILGADPSTAHGVGAALAFPMLLGGSVLGWWLAKRSRAKTAPPSLPVRAWSAGAAKPGWYSDPQGQLRWWDGGAWTHHVAPTNAAPTQG